jgi:glycosyltransferase involved in cell wall biosynthesis
MMIKNILFINTGVNWGGVEGWHFKTTTALQKRGYHIFVLAAKDRPFYNKCKTAGFETAFIRRIENNTWLNPFRIIWLIKYLKDHQIEAVFFCQASHFKYVSLAAKLAGVKRIIYRRAIAEPIKNHLYNKLLLKYCITNFMAISKITRDESLKYIPAKYLPEEKIALIYNGVNLDEFTKPEIRKHIREEFDIKEDELVLANIGRICRQKGQIYLIEALPYVLKSFTKFKLLLVGAGSKEEIAMKRIKELGVEDKIIFAGFRNDVPAILSMIDFLVHTAIYEGCPWVIIEAMAAGKPIVSSNIDSVAEIMVDGENGYLAASENSEDIAAKILKMIHNPERGKMGEKGRKIVEEKFTFDEKIDRIEALYLKG